MASERNFFKVFDELESLKSLDDGEALNARLAEVGKLLYSFPTKEGIAAGESPSTEPKLPCPSTSM